MKEFNLWYQANMEEFVELQLKYINYRPSNSIKTHLITFTMKPGLDKDLFSNAVQKQLSRNLFFRVKYTSEHRDTNFHYHAWVTTKYSLTHKRFDSHAKKWGNVNVQPPSTDNGIDEYFSKENEVFYKALGAEATKDQYERVQISP